MLLICGQDKNVMTHVAQMCDGIFSSLNVVTKMLIEPLRGRGRGRDRGRESQREK